MSEAGKKRMAKARRAYNAQRAADSITAVISCKYASHEVQSMGLDIIKQIDKLKEVSKNDDTAPRTD